mmetsp:Transcript_19462/g.74651  ORF Transcript_19462/g.74651 Transcript_19462/m.74651 type:complete len:238 (+) Transcript_19462:584-1297(+)
MDAGVAGSAQARNLHGETKGRVRTEQARPPRQQLPLADVCVVLCVVEAVLAVRLRLQRLDQRLADVRVGCVARQSWACTGGASSRAGTRCSTGRRGAAAGPVAVELVHSALNVFDGPSGKPLVPVNGAPVAVPRRPLQPLLVPSPEQAPVAHNLEGSAEHAEKLLGVRLECLSQRHGQDTVCWKRLCRCSGNGQGSGCRHPQAERVRVSHLQVERLLECLLLGRQLRLAGDGPRNGP